VVLFLALFASQSAVLVLSPILADVADELGVSIAQAGQLRIVAAPLAAVVAVLAARALGRVSPRALLVVGSALVGAGSVASAAAPTFAVLALAQVPMWAGIATLLAAGVAATSLWSEPGDRTRVVARALAGPPAAWIVGMPLIGIVSTVDWRLAFLALPLPAAVLAGVAALCRPADAPVSGVTSSLLRLLRRADARRWAIGELMANSAWAGTLVFVGALLTERHGLSHATTGIALAAVASAFLAGNQWAGRSSPERARRTMLEGTLAAAAAVGLAWSLTPSVWVTVALLGASAAVTAARFVAATVHGFALAPDLAREVGATRAATTQVGYLLGSLVGGIALTTGGFSLLGLAFGGLFLAATLPYVGLRAAVYRPAAEPG
jgi:predicted MFS family arabinose efflux permease